MYIQPNSTIKLYKNVPLDTTYEHTLWFDNVSAQNNFFHNNSAILLQTFDGQTYQRVVKGEMTLGVNAESIYTCNYLSFRNTAFGTKWFYAFVTSVEYVSNTASKLTFEIDVMQTYLFDVTLKECFVEREHSKTDNIGDNIIAENLDFGDYLQQGDSIRIFENESLEILQNVIIVATSVEYNNSEWKPVQGTLISNVYQGCKFYYFQPTIVNPDGGVNAFLNDVTQNAKEDSILSIFMCPRWLYDGVTNGNEYNATKSIGNLRGNSISGYIPKNNKLFTYPYNLLYATTGNSSTNYKFEYFINPSNISFKLSYQLSTTPSAMIVPKDYYGGRIKRSNLDYYGDIDNSLILDGFPICSYTIDSFRAWLAQNQYNLTSSIIGLGANTTLNALDGGVSGTGILNSGLSTVTSLANATLLPPSSRGNASSNNLLFSDNMSDIFVCRKAIHGQYARKIDNFFSKYGYATMQLKVPNRNVRKQWTYCKTNGCVVVGNAPADDVRRICEIYDRGITFWKNGSNVGNYELDNSPV